MRNLKKMAITAICFMMAAFIGCSSTNDTPKRKFRRNQDRRKRQTNMGNLDSIRLL